MLDVQIISEHDTASLNAAIGIIDDAWEELRRSPSVQRQMGAVPARLPEVSFAEAQRRSAVGRSLLRRLDELESSPLPHDLALTLRLVRFRSNSWAREAEWYWMVVDPLGEGYFGLFLPTAYCGGFVFTSVHDDLASFPFAESGDTDRYLALVADYARLIDQFTERTAGQAERDIRMPKVQVRQARALLGALKAGVREVLTVSAQRLVAIPAANFSRELETRIKTRIEPAFDRAIEGLSNTYLARAPEKVGIGQYSGGSEVYAELVKLHTTLALTPEQVHARGIARMEEIAASKDAIREELHSQTDDKTFIAHLNQDPRWRANTVEGVRAMFHRYIDRLKPRFSDYFYREPQATYGVAPLPEALQSSMTYGYYDVPREGHAAGIYRFNASNLTKQALVHIGSLTYHELMPGHHLHFATQRENELLHPFRKYNFVNAYNEGWAEYAAMFAGEIGLYEQPEERYGRLAMDAFLTCRLVVDTGMNVLGWSLERARDYMRANSGMSEAEIRTESLRYSCDIPGQALAYKLGDASILGFREQMRRTLGERFNLKDFHAAVLGAGALPIPDLEWHVEHETKRLMNSGRKQ